MSTRESYCTKWGVWHGPSISLHYTYVNYDFPIEEWIFVSLSRSFFLLLPSFSVFEAGLIMTTPGSGGKAHSHRDIRHVLVK